MYASASTWLFNISRAIVETAESRVIYGTRFVRTMGDILAGPALDTLPVAVVKSHETDTGAAAWLAARATSIIVTVRDPRDAVVSMMRHQELDFDTALEWAALSAGICAKQANDPRTLVLRFEDGFTEDISTVGRVAAAMGYSLRSYQAVHIFGQHTRAVVEAKIAELERSGRIFHEVGGSDFVDPETQWHRHHAGRQGHIGGWLDHLSPDQVIKIEDRLKSSKDNFGANL